MIAKNHKSVFSHSFRGQQFEIKASAGLILSGGSDRQSILCLFLASGGHSDPWCSLVCGCITPYSPPASHDLLSLFSYSYKDTVIGLRLTQIIQASSQDNLITSTKTPFFPNKATFPMGISFGGHQPTHYKYEITPGYLDGV